MNPRVRSGVLLLATALAIVGAAANAVPSASAEDAAPSDVLSSERVTVSQPANSSAAVASVPLRSGLLNEQEQPPAAAPRPVEVRIAGIGLQASILSVGVDENHEFDVPEADTVGWYQYSSLPGLEGSTVLAAHVDYAGVEGAFFNLRALTIGETLELEMEDGEVLTYEVVENVLYDKTELPAKELFRRDGKPVLQLITCGGSFDPTNQSYVGNLVVTAELI